MRTMFGLAARPLTIGLVSLAAFVQPASRGAFTPIRTTAEEIPWPAAPGAGCSQQVVVAGDMTAPRLYSTRMKFAAGCKVQPHSHPNDRVVVVLEGTMYVGFGAAFDEGGLKALPPGSVWTEPGSQNHFAWAKDGDVILQVSGIGPYGITPAKQ